MAISNQQSAVSKDRLVARVSYATTYYKNKNRSRQQRCMQVYGVVPTPSDLPDRTARNFKKPKGQTNKKGE